MPTSDGMGSWLLAPVVGFLQDAETRLAPEIEVHHHDNIGDDSAERGDRFGERARRQRDRAMAWNAAVRVSAAAGSSSAVSTVTPAAELLGLRKSVVGTVSVGTPGDRFQDRRWSPWQHPVARSPRIPRTDRPARRSPLR
jgi:hypothetical protein